MKGHVRDGLTIGEETIDLPTWAGSIPQQRGTAPHVRVGRDRWFDLLWLIPIGFVGLLRYPNHIYGTRDDASWAGFAVFAATMVIVVVGWVTATSFTLRHPRVVQRVGFALIGPVQRLLEHVDVRPGEYGERDISPYFWHNGHYPDAPECTALAADDFAGYRLGVSGLVDNPVELSLDELRAPSHHEQITQHFCIQGWPGVAK